MSRSGHSQSYIEDSLMINLSAGIDPIYGVTEEKVEKAAKSFSIEKSDFEIRLSEISDEEINYDFPSLVNPKSPQSGRAKKEKSKKKKKSNENLDIAKFLQELAHNKDEIINLSSGQDSESKESSVAYESDRYEGQIDISNLDQLEYMSYEPDYLITAKEPSYIESCVLERPKGRLDNVLVGSQDENSENSFLEDHLVNKYLIDRKLDDLSAPLVRKKLKRVHSEKLSRDEVLDYFRLFDLPDITDHQYQLVLGIREQTGSFLYVDHDVKKTKRSKYYTDWVEIKTGLFYKGQLTRNGKRHGIGMELTERHLYEGFWRNNKRHGLGRLITVEGDIFEGRWVLDMKIGFGTL